jgi:hypothetical protein
VLRKIFGSKRDEDGSWRKLHNDELHNLYSSLNIVRVIKIKVNEVRRKIGTYGVGEKWGPKSRDHGEDLGVGGRITLSWTVGA